MQSFHRLNLIDGSILLIKAPVFSHLSKPDHFEIRAYHLELLQQVQALRGYHLPEADSVLFSHFEPLYQAVASRLTPKVDPRQLDSVSRHRFFIATDPVELGEQLVPGLSELETLMGYELPTSPPEQSNEVRLTSGDDDADLVASLLLTFKDNALPLMSRYSRRDLISMLLQAQNLLRGEEALKELQAERDRETFEKNQAQIDQQFADLGAFFF